MDCPSQAPERMPGARPSGSVLSSALTCPPIHAGAATGPGEHLGLGKDRPSEAHFPT